MIHFRSSNRSRACWLTVVLFAATGMPAVAGLPIYDEPADFEVLDPDGNPTPGPNFIRTMPFCGSTEGSVTVEDLKAHREWVRQQQATIQPEVVTSAGLRGERAAQGGGGLNITFNTFGVPAVAQDALADIALFIESRFGDNTSITMDVMWQPIGGGTLGFTSSGMTTQGYSTVRGLLQGDMDDSDGIQEFFPPGSTIPVRYNDASATVVNENLVILTMANWRAIGGTGVLNVADITINSSVNWDYVPSNGVPFSAFDFWGVVIHEVGHAMGFISEQDNPSANNIALLDAFRFRTLDGCCDYNPETLAEFGTTPRLVDFNTPNDGHHFDHITHEWDLADGDPDQASHWRQGEAGLMDPSTANGETSYPEFYFESDLTAFDGIGWDYPIEDGGVPLPLVDTFPGVTLNATLWTGVDGADGSTRGQNEPSASFSLNLNDDSIGGNRVRTAILDAAGVSDLTLRYYFETQGVDFNPPEVGEDLIVEYLNSADDWVEINRHFGDGTGMTDYVLVTLSLPAAAMHSGLRVQFRTVSTELGLGDGDWFVDDVCIGSFADCTVGCEVPSECPGFVNPCTLTECIANECVDTPIAGSCDDGDICTTDTCAGGECVGTPLDCGDGIGCTVDTCDPVNGCVNTPSNGLCNDSNPCTDDSCDALSDCVFTPNDLCGGIEVLVEDKSADCALADTELCNVYIQLGDPADRLLSIGFVAIATDDPDGFFQFPAAMGGSDTAPQEILIGLFPDLVCDSFVTIGLKSVAIGATDCTTLDPDFDTNGFNTGGAMAGGWFCNNPSGGQGDGSAYPDNRVLVAQLSVGSGFNASGDVTIFINDGMVEIPGSFVCFSTCPPDLNGDGLVNAADLALLLGAWGPNPGHPADFNSDGSVNAADLALLLGAWGPC